MHCRHRSEEWLLQEKPVFPVRKMWVLRLKTDAVPTDQLNSGGSVRTLTSSQMSVYFIFLNQRDTVRTILVCYGSAAAALHLAQPIEPDRTKNGLIGVKNVSSPARADSPWENTEAVTPGSSFCISAIRSPTLISIGWRKNQHFSFLEGNGTSRTKRPYLYFKEASAAQH